MDCGDDGALCVQSSREGDEGKEGKIGGRDDGEEEEGGVMRWRERKGKARIMRREREEMKRVK